MTLAHGKDTVITVDGDDISEFITSSEFDQGGEIEDVTTYGNSAKRKAGSIKEHSFSMEGVYHAKASGTPAELFDGHVMETFSLVRRTEGVGTGKPSQAFDAVLGNYVETNPAAEYIKWSAEFELDGDVTPTTQ